MKRLAWLPFLATLCWFGAGCASIDVNPTEPRSDRGYVDLYSTPKKDLWWKVDVFDPAHQDFKPFTAQYKTPGLDIFRIAARPGKYRARIAFLNESIEAPTEVDVEVVAEMLTPVEVKFEKGTKGYTRKVDDRLTGPRRRKVTDYEEELWRITATAEPPRAYAPKEAMQYQGLLSR